MSKELSPPPLFCEKWWGAKIIFIGLIFFVLPAIVSADSLGQQTNFFVDPSYDLYNRSEISATCRRVGSNAYFYIDDEYWQGLTDQEKETIKQFLQDLDQEFSNNIYPTLTSTYGFEWRPGIDKDYLLTILIHPIKEDAGGYFNPGDEYPKVQVPTSNQREMLYLNTAYITDNLMSSFLAHEFTHLITFNQKNKMRGVEEEVWLNEARAEYSPTLVGYDQQNLADSNLQQRIETFLENPSDSLTEWRNFTSDYGVINLFIQYLVDHYGVEILAESLRSDKIGIPSINYALKKQGYKTDFSDVFTDWTVAVLVNDCSLGERYCYRNKTLRDFRVIPLTNFLPLVGKSSLRYGNSTQNWSGNWLKIIGGKGTLKLEFDGSDEVNFRVPYVLEDIEGKKSVKYLELNPEQDGTIFIPDFGSDFSSLTIIPSIQTKISGFSDSEPYYSFFWQATTQEDEELQELAEEKLIQELLAQVEELKRQIAAVQAEIQKILAKRAEQRERISCQRFDNNLYFGMKNDEVRCLQEFLKQEGRDIYPEGLVTGYFGYLTQAAVIRFQEKYADEILKPLGLVHGTGYFGPRTRAIVNKKLFNL